VEASLVSEIGRRKLGEGLNGVMNKDTKEARVELVKRFWCSL
jgi:hypothetical protein